MFPAYLWAVSAQFAELSALGHVYMSGNTIWSPSVIALVLESLVSINRRRCETTMNKMICSVMNCMGLKVKFSFTGNEVCGACTFKRLIVIAYITITTKMTVAIRFIRIKIDLQHSLLLSNLSKIVCPHFANWHD